MANKNDYKSRWGATKLVWVKKPGAKAPSKSKSKKKGK